MQIESEVCPTKNCQNFLSDLKTHLERNMKGRAVVWIGCNWMKMQNRRLYQNGR